MSDSEFKSIGDLLNSEPGFSKTRKLIEESEVVYYFTQIFPQFANIAEAVKVEKKALHLKIENAAWRNELKFREKEIVETVNAYFKDKRIKTIKFII